MRYSECERIEEHAYTFRDEIACFLRRQLEKFRSGSGVELTSIDVVTLQAMWKCNWSNYIPTKSLLEHSIQIRETIPTSDDMLSKSQGGIGHVLTLWPRGDVVCQ